MSKLNSILARNATSQVQRQPLALKNGYVKVDERTHRNLVDFLELMAPFIQYYNANNKKDGGWQAFFPKLMHLDDAEWKTAYEELLTDTPPHLALYLSFLESYRYAQAHINTIPERHLALYYREILCLTNRKAVPDQVHVGFELAKNIKSHRVKEGTLLDAGKDETGVELIYKTDADIVVNKAKITALKTVFIDRKFNNKFYAAPVANSSDGIGGELPEEVPAWLTFGEAQHTKNPGKETMVEAEIGFSIASPILNMSEGKRTVTLGIYASSPISSDAAKVAPFNVYFSGEKEWIGPFSASLQHRVKNTYDLIVTIPADQAAVIPYDKEVLGGNFDTTYPVMKVLFDNPATLTGKENPDTTLDENPANPPYLTWATEAIKQIDIDIAVEGVSNLLLQNDLAKIEPGKPFAPFGQVPIKGATFYIGSQEVLYKNVKSLEVKIEWLDLPDETFDAYFATYKEASKDLSIPIEDDPDQGATINITNASTLVIPSILIDKKWSTYKVSDEEGAAPIKISPFFDYTPGEQSDYSIPFPESMTLDLSSKALNKGRNLNTEILEQFDNNTQNGFIKLELINNDFGHRDFANVLTKQSVALGRNAALTTPAVPGPALPNPPLTPTIKTISLDYTSSQTLFLNDTKDLTKNKERYENRIERYFHNDVFGEAEIHPYTHGYNDSFSPSYAVTLLPHYANREDIEFGDDPKAEMNEGNLYIGIEDLVPPQNLSILFHVDEGSADPDQPVAASDFTISCLGKHQWHQLSDLQILSDSSKGLITSGIMTIQIPEDCSTTNTLMPTGSHWLRISAKNNSGGVAKMIDLSTQMVTASFVDNNNDPYHLRNPLAAESIGDLVVADSAIKSVTQPHASFNGRIEEQADEFNIRVSERLRHKHRCVTPWDFERLVLENFPSIYQVKCLSHTDKQSLDAAGKVMLIVVPNLRNKKGVNLLAPKTDYIKLQEIKAFVEKYTSPFADVIVSNPNYEEVKMDFKVKFHPGFDEGYYAQKLNNEIIKFLSPWTYDEGKDITFFGSIYKSSVLEFVEERPYVDFLTDFNFAYGAGIGTAKIMRDFRVFSNIEEACPSSPRAILISSAQHKIEVISAGTPEEPPAYTNIIEVNGTVKSNDYIKDSKDTKQNA